MTRTTPGAQSRVRGKGSPLQLDTEDDADEELAETDRGEGGLQPDQGVGAPAALIAGRADDAQDQGGKIEEGNEEKGTPEPFDPSHGDRKEKVEEGLAREGPGHAVPGPDDEGARPAGLEQEEAEADGVQIEVAAFVDDDGDGEEPGDQVVGIDPGHPAAVEPPFGVVGMP